jgi:hypothetical protein
VVSPLEVRRPDKIRTAATPAKWQQTAWGKILIGLVLAQGLYFGQRMLIGAVLAATGGELPAQDSFAGLLLIQFMQLISLLVGGAMAGAGQRRGTLFGAVVGMYNGVLFLFIHSWVLGNQLEPLTLIMLPILQIAFATGGGFIGSQIWKPIQLLAQLPAPPEERPAAEQLPVVPPLLKAPLFAGPVNWVRVAGGTALAVLGSIGADRIYKFIELTTAPGPGDTPRQASFLTWEISVLAVLIGGAFAGSNSHNGMKQGLVLGIFASLVLAFYFVMRGETEATKSPNWLFQQLGLGGAALFEKIVFTTMYIVTLGLAAGWFGCQLLPPVVIPRGEKRMLPGIMS